MRYVTKSTAMVMVRGEMGMPPPGTRMDGGRTELRLRRLRRRREGTPRRLVLLLMLLLRQE